MYTCVSISGRCGGFWNKCEKSLKTSALVALIAKKEYLLWKLTELPYVPIKKSTNPHRTTLNCVNMYNAYMCIYVYFYVCKCIRMNIRIYPYICKYISMSTIYTSMCVVYNCVSMYTFICINVYTCICAIWLSYRFHLTLWISKVE